LDNYGKVLSQGQDKGGVDQPGFRSVILEKLYKKWGTE
jgi:hypothetical protein